MFQRDSPWNAVSWAETAPPCVLERRVGIFPVLGPGRPKQAGFLGEEIPGDMLINLYSQIITASQVQPYPVNYSETGTFLGNINGNINYAPYASCP